jgi:hypothetical protein
MNEEETDRTMYPHFFLDTPDYLHFIGAMRHDMKLGLRYRGFMWEI